MGGCGFGSQLVTIEIDVSECEIYLARRESGRIFLIISKYLLFLLLLLFVAVVVYDPASPPINQ